MTPPDLNERQRAYLLASLRTDQAAEEHHKRAYQRGNFDESRRPASDWRAMPFGVILGYGGPVPTMLRRECGGADEGSGSAWAALAKRGLLTVQDRDVHYHPGEVLPRITLTTKGRKLARELSGQKLEKRPKGVLMRSTWRTLAAAWAAGETGLQSRGGGDYGGVSWDTWLSLLNYRTGGRRVPLVQEFSRKEPLPLRDDPYHHQNVYFIRLTEAGRAFYVQRWEANHAAYPDIEAPKPRVSTDKLLAILF